METDHQARRRQRFILLGCIAWTMLGVRCTTTQKTKIEQAVAQPTVAAAESSPAETVRIPPPRVDEVKGTINRVFKEAAALSSNNAPAFIVGDFNGDRSTDLAVVLTAAPGKLPDMNQKYPPWILKNIFSSDRAGSVPPGVEKDETLLAVIHGYGESGWRDPQATQTFLLKSAVGANMQTVERASFLKDNEGKKLPRLQGDLIREVLKGKPGWLYYADSTYRWYDPETFKGQPERRVVHPGISVPMTK